MQANRKDLGAAAIFVLIAAFFAVDALRHLRIGTAVNMGPGYFPLLLAGVLLLLAGLIALRGFRTSPAPFGVWPWRGVLLILGAPVVFCFTIRGLGLLPTTFLTALLSAFASTQIRTHVAVALSGGIALFCCLVFVWGINMPIPVFGRWLALGIF